ncbi:high mobility group box-domain-containing protein [Rhypophila decipiens]|uniref:High mobility group box-domain-containing protein n=1 Tax=Rhypophila decipiens TaxID=261697 RepID=A0AAN6Y418_9PEZI|nr:high mobility group box-domain-containing protein [Rhypophila decipiens]
MNTNQSPAIVDISSVPMTVPEVTAAPFEFTIGSTFADPLAIENFDPFGTQFNILGDNMANVGVYNEDFNAIPLEDDANDVGIRVPRPRNSFILYRQWMSKKLRTENPSLTAGSISQIVGSLWRTESARVKAHFQQLSRVEEERHRKKHPEYRYEARRVHEPTGARPRPILRGMHIAERLILSGH